MHTRPISGPGVSDGEPTISSLSGGGWQGRDILWRERRSTGNRAGEQRQDGDRCALMAGRRHRDEEGGKDDEGDEEVACGFEKSVDVESLAHVSPRSSFGSCCALVPIEARQCVRVEPAMWQAWWQFVARRFTARGVTFLQTGLRAGLRLVCRRLVTWRSATITLYLRSSPHGPRFLRVSSPRPARFVVPAFPCRPIVDCRAVMRNCA